ncbi:FIG00849076: hypothetical protein [Neisseria meningitidis serogroup B]|uniref:Uncharacterized protein n=1 Tax=Neisseria meningitidis serogroup B TaxID=491 RepID=A0A0H5QDQ8_NEIMI|nr:FIG00849076: hypothetical protein [Neisseria meningitidis serogroup B]
MKIVLTTSMAGLGGTGTISSIAKWRVKTTPFSLTKSSAASGATFPIGKSST